MIGHAAPRRRWWTRPRVALPVLAAVMTLTVLVAPQQRDARDGDPRLSTYSAAPQGARLLHDLARALGWDVERKRVPGAPRDSTAILALLAPPVTPTAPQTHAILEHVRRGGALLYVIGDGGPLNDSLGVGRGTGDVAAVVDEIRGPITPECEEATNGALPLWFDRSMYLWSIAWRRPPAEPAVVFAELPSSRGEGDAGPVRRARATAPRHIAAAGFALGAGRVVVVADPDLLRNDALRVCRWGADVVAIRMLEYLGDGIRRPIVFDEYHQGYGIQPGILTTVAGFLARTPPGHLIAQLALAGLLLVLARAPRIVPPRHVEHVPRRSPLEHVQALARAYEKVGAASTAIVRLLAGLRRRVSRLGAPPLAGSGDTAAFLDWVARRAPAARDDVEVLRQLLAGKLKSRDVAAAGQAIRRMEAALLASPGAHAPLIQPSSSQHLPAP